MEADTSTSTLGTWSRSDEQVDRLPNGRVSFAQPDAFDISHHRIEASSPIGPLRLPSGPSYPSILTSLAAYSLSGLNSPRMVDHYPLSASPPSATVYKENSFDLHTSATTCDARGHTDPITPYLSTSYSHPLHHISSTTPPAAYGSRYRAPIDLPSLTSFREPVRLPPLTHEVTALSSSGGDGGYKIPFSRPLLPFINAQKSMRMLSQRVPSLGAKPSPPP